MKTPQEEAERERDEAQRVIREQHAQVIGLYAQEAELRNERDQLRKEVEKAYREGARGNGLNEVAVGMSYHFSRAKRVAEGME